MCFIGPEVEGQSGASYGAMLLDYAKRTEASATSDGNPACTEKTVANAGILRNGNESKLEQNVDAWEDRDGGQPTCGGRSNGTEYSVALSLNYEVRGGIIAC